MALRDPEAGASPLALFGAELRHYRTAAGLSQEQLGERIGYSAALVGAVETARRMPTEDFTARCDVVDELGTGGALLALGVANNIYTQIGLVLLIALSAKNAMIGRAHV